MIDRQGDNMENGEKKRKIMSYPEIEYTRKIYPSLEILLNKDIIWEEKRDGSNCGAYMDDGQIRFRSRHMEIAEHDTIEAIYRTKHVKGLIDCLEESKNQRDSDDVIFFEFLRMGKSPSRVELHKEDDLVVFDIYSSKDGWLNYEDVYEKCSRFGLPIVQVLGTSRHDNTESLIKYCDEMVGKCLEEKREGVVGKIWIDGEILLFKEKPEMYKTATVKIRKKRSESTLPMLPESEIMGAIEKVLMDIGIDQFGNAKTAMPLVARYVNEESKKHNCQKVKKLFDYYQRRLEDLKEEKKG